MVYGLIFSGLILGLSVLLLTPFPTETLNYLVGGAFLIIAVATVTYLIAGFSGPDERGPNF